MGDSPLSAKGLAEALQTFGDEKQKDSGVAFHVHVADFDLWAPLALIIYHVARQAVENALRHARADDIWIDVSRQSQAIVVGVQDNGRGFDTEAPSEEGRYGIVMMHERVEVAGGEFSLKSTPGKGTVINARFPLAGPWSGS
jgi:signal transduction histidine kinase